MRMPILAAVAAVAAACSAAPRSSVETTPDEDRLIAYLVRDPYVVVRSTERDADGALLVVTAQGQRQVRYLIAADDPARPQLKLRRMEDDSTLETAANPVPGGDRDATGRR